MSQENSLLIRASSACASLYQENKTAKVVAHTTLLTLSVAAIILGALTNYVPAVAAVLPFSAVVGKVLFFSGIATTTSLVVLAALARFGGVVNSSSNSKQSDCSETSNTHPNQGATGQNSQQPSVINRSSLKNGSSVLLTPVQQPVPQPSVDSPRQAAFPFNHNPPSQATPPSTPTLQKTQSDSSTGVQMTGQSSPSKTSGTPFSITSPLKNSSAKKGSQQLNNYSEVSASDGSNQKIKQYNIDCSVESLKTGQSLKKHWMSNWPTDGTEFQVIDSLKAVYLVSWSQSSSEYTFSKK